MQTSISQSLFAAAPAEGGKISPAKSITQSGFSALFSLLKHEDTLMNSKPETVSEPDTEIPDELQVLDVKIQPPQTNKITNQQTQEGPVATKIPNRVENITRASNTHQAPPEEMGIDPPQRPTNTNFKLQNPQQTPIKQQSDVPTDSDFQLPQTTEPPAKTRDSRMPNLPRDLATRQIDTRPSALALTNFKIAINQNGLLRFETAFEQVKPATPEFIEGDRTPNWVSQELGEWSKIQPSVSSAPAATLQQHAAPILTAAPVNPVEAGEDVDTFKLVPEISEPELARLNMNVSLHPTSGAGQQLTSAGTVRSVGNQMVDVLIRQPGQPVELTLNPEELGRVRISLTTLDSGLSVTIMAERPETLDLMRRHIEQLETEFRQLGYESIGFEFSGDDAHSSEQSDTASPSKSDQKTDVSDANPPSPMSAQTTGVDIRL